MEHILFVFQLLREILIHRKLINLDLVIWFCFLVFKSSLIFLRFFIVCLIFFLEGYYHQSLTLYVFVYPFFLIWSDNRYIYIYIKKNEIPTDRPFCMAHTFTLNTHWPKVHSIHHAQFLNWLNLARKKEEFWQLISAHWFRTSLFPLIF